MTMLRHLATILSVVFSTAVFSGCSGIFGGNEDEPENSASETYDGTEPYVYFEMDEVSLPAASQDIFYIEFYTNLLNPQIEVLPESPSSEPVAVVSVYPYPDTENGGYCTVGLDVIPNITGESRYSTLSVRSSSSETGSVRLVQEPSAFCELDGEVQATYNSLVFTFRTNPQTSCIRYFLSDRDLSDSEIRENFYDSSEYEDKYLEEGAVSFELAFDGLNPASEYYLYLRPMGEHDDILVEDYFLMVEASTAMPGRDLDLVLEVSANPANNFTVYLPFSTYAIDGTVDWGDGTVESFDHPSGSTISHEYDITETTSFEVRFSGILTDMSLSGYAPDAARYNTLISVKQWGYTGLESIDLSYISSLLSIAPDTHGAFSNVKHFGVEPYGGSFSDTGITEIPEGFFDYAVNATSFDSTFRGCENLEEIPEGLFDNCPAAQSFSRTFLGCKLLESIPDGLFSSCRQASSFYATFARCESLKSIPEDLFSGCPGIVALEGTFAGCVSLTEIPEGLFAGNSELQYIGLYSMRDASGGYRGGSGIFEGCSSLKAVPEDLFSGCDKIADASCAFKGCSSLTTLPAGLFSSCKGIKYLESTFSGCSSLASLPAGLFDSNRQMIVMTEMFSGCRKLAGESPYTVVDGKKVHLYERGQYMTEFVAPDRFYNCFEDCTGLSDYESMPSDWR